jgi:hypothetical protein
MSTELNLSASQLRPGDVLVPTSTTVISAPEAGARTPSGKVDLTVRYRNGTERWVTWGARTRMRVRRG